MSGTRSPETLRALEYAERLREIAKDWDAETYCGTDGPDLIGAALHLEALHKAHSAESQRADTAELERERLKAAISVQHPYDMAIDFYISLATCHREDSERVDAYEEAKEALEATCTALRAQLEEKVGGRS